MTTVRRQPRLGDLVDLADQSSRDASASASSLRHRDRAIGQDLADLESQPLAQSLGWLQRVAKQGGRTVAGRVDTVHHLGLLVLAVAGLFAGWATAAVVFYYDGTHPVNVIHALAVFVLLPLVMLVFFGLGLLPRRVVRFVPGMAAVRDALSMLNPGRLQRFMVRYLPQGSRDTVAAFLGKGQAHQRLYGGVDRWVMTHSSQTFALAFNVGAVVSCLYLIVFSDLAFSWSTTLQFGAADLKRWTDVLAVPWAWFFADARPSLELIESTRYFRLGDGSFPAAQSPSGLGGWWPFLVMCMVVYGVLPRLVTLLFARARQRAALRKTFLNYPGLADVRMRLNSELVETRAEEPELATERASGALSLAGNAVSAGGPAVIIDWSAAVEDRDSFTTWIASAVDVAVTAWFEAGGVRSLAADRQAVTAAIEAADSANLVVVTKAWEPPMTEFLDFLRDMRAAAGETRVVHVLPVGQPTAGAPTLPEPRHIDLWRRVLTRLGDPWLGLVEIAEGDA